MMQGTSIQLAPVVPPALLWALALASLAVVALLWARRATGAGWRTLAIVLLLLAVANPSLVREQRAVNPDIALLLVDRSDSQRIADRQAATDAAVAAVEARLRALSDLEVRRVDVTSGRLGEEADRGTRLFEAAAQARSDIPARQFAGTIAITDGQAHDAPDLDADAPPPGPFHVLLTGGADEADRRLVVVNAPRFGLVGRELAVTIRVEDGATPTGTPVPVVVRRDGSQAGQVSVLAPVGEDYTLPLTLDRRGPTVLEVVVEPGPQELTLDNNRAVLSLNGVRDRLRVLLVSGEPHAGERTWRSLLKSDPSVDLVHFTILRPPEKQDGTPIRELSLISFPVRELFELKLEEFDLVIFDRYRRRGVLPYSYLNNIVDYVQNGGALLKAVGPTFATPLSLYATPLGTILPGEPTGEIYEQGFRPQVTPVGQRHPVTSALPGANRAPLDDGEAEAARWGRWFRHIGVQQTSGEALMSGVGGLPLILLERVGEGRVAQVQSDHMWLWTRGYEGGGPQAELLRRMAHWLMKEPDLEEDGLTAEVRGNQLQVVRRSLRPDDSPVTVVDPLGGERQLEIKEDGSGRGTAVLTIEQAGIYQVSDGARSALAVAGPPNPLEFADVRATEQILAPVVSATDGGLFRLADLRSVTGIPDIRRVKPQRSHSGNGWLGLVANGDFRVIGVDRVGLVPPLLALIAIALAMVLAWRREAR